LFSGLKVLNLTFALRFRSMQQNGIQLGLKENWKQFTLLVIVNAFVGGMVGMERSILPMLASETFHIQAKFAILSFITIFGVSKAVANFFSGKLSDKIGRRNVLILGWILAIPVPYIIIYAQSWNWVVFANVLLGIHQGFAWSSTVVMKIDLVGEKQRGLAMGLNEFAGYLSVAIMAMITSFVAEKYGVRPYPFYLGIGLIILGLIVAIFFVKDTLKHSQHESKSSNIPQLKNVFVDTTWRNSNLGSITQAGLVNNLNDGMVWGLLPVLLALQHFNIKEIGIVAGIYPAIWGLGQLVTGKMADLFSKKRMLFWGMSIQGSALFVMIFADSFLEWICISAVLGIGTALVYPTFLASIAQCTNPIDRAQSLGVFRFWRDLGYAIGAVSTGIIADHFGINTAIFSIALVTLLSAIIIQIRFKEHGNININR